MFELFHIINKLWIDLDLIPESVNLLLLLLFSFISVLLLEVSLLLCIQK